MKTVLITGVSRGIGMALAHEFASRGFQVIGTSTTGTVSYSLENMSVLPLDLSKPASITDCVSAIKKNGASIDILVNNAGVLLDDGESAVIVDKLRKTLEVNLIGTIDFTEQILPFVNKDGHIINMSSSAGSLAGTFMQSSIDYPAYKISKVALNMYTIALSKRLQAEDPRSITVSSVHPGWVKTEMGGDDATMDPEEAAKYIADLAISKPETGQFWHKGKRFPW